MDRNYYYLYLFVILLAAYCGVATAQRAPVKADSSAATALALQSAREAYQKEDFVGAATKLENLLNQNRSSVEVHELLGLTYAAQARTLEAVEQFQAAVTLDPKSAAAENNLAIALVRAGKQQQAEVEYLRALEIAPQDYHANRNLAGLYLQSDRVVDALPLLEHARRERPDAYDNGYDLALAYLLTDQAAKARQMAVTLMQQKPSGELHTLLGRIDEKEGRFVEAAKDFEAAAHLDPSEDNLFVWATELLLHRTYVAAIAVFRQANERYPESSRLLIGLGMSLYSRGEYEEAIRSLVKAADLNPADPRCYVYLSKAFLSSPDQANDVVERFRRYAKLSPASALAQYYYAISLWKGRRLDGQPVDYVTVESLLRKSIALDDTLAETHLQLGILYTDEHAYEKSLPEYQRTLQLTPGSADAHFRMGRYYLHAGDKIKADNEFEVFKSLQAKHQAEEDKARAEVQQFVISEQPTPAQR